MNQIRRGHLKFYVLRLLSRSRSTGYGLMKTIEEETGFWKPSAGSLYPLLASMRSTGLIEEVEEPDGSTRWQITDDGRTAYAEAADSKQELFDSMKRSLLVFSRVFDAGPLASMVGRLDPWQQSRQDLRTLGPLFMDLHDVLWSLPPLDSGQQDTARSILEEAIERITRLRQP